MKPPTSDSSSYGETAHFCPRSYGETAHLLHVLRAGKKNMKHVVEPVDPVKTGRTGRSESEEDPFKVKTGENWIGKNHRGETRAESPVPGRRIAQERRLRPWAIPPRPWIVRGLQESSEGVVQASRGSTRPLRKSNAN